MGQNEIIILEIKSELRKIMGRYGLNFGEMQILALRTLSKMDNDIEKIKEKRQHEEHQGRLNASKNVLWK